MIIISVSKWTGETTRRRNTSKMLQIRIWLQMFAKWKERGREREKYFLPGFYEFFSSFYRWQMPLTTYVYIKLKEQSEEKHLLTHSNPTQKWNILQAHVACVCIWYSYDFASAIAIWVYLCWWAAFVTVISIYFDILLAIRSSEGISCIRHFCSTQQQSCPSNKWL